MCDQEIIASLVKVRERCRQLEQWYQQLRTQNWNEPGRAEVPPHSLQKADHLLSQVLLRLNDLPRKPSHNVADPTNRGYVEELLQEIGDFLERAMVYERELRRQVHGGELPPVGQRRDDALRSYCGV